MLRDDAAYFASRYEDAVREPDETWRRWVAEAGDDAPKALFAAVEGESWLGVVGGFVRVDPAEVHLISMWVAPEARGRGVAKALIRELARWTLARGASTILLFVQEANTPARQPLRTDRVHAHGRPRSHRPGACRLQAAAHRGRRCARGDRVGNHHLLVAAGRHAGAARTSRPMTAKGERAQPPPFIFKSSKIRICRIGRSRCTSRRPRSSGRWTPRTRADPRAAA